MEHEISNFLLNATPGELIKLREMISEKKDKAFDQVLHSLNQIIHNH